jgi:glucokinase
VTPIGGIDVGGTKCLGVVYDADDRSSGRPNIVTELRRPTPHADGLVDVLGQLIRDLGEVQTIGVGIPGLITRDGVMRASPNIAGSNDVAVGAELRRRLSRQVWVDNDANVAALAEWRFGAGLGARNMWMVTLGTGIGGGHLVNGVIQRGVNGFAGEIGHMIVDAEGPPCTCGRNGCWEVYASGRGLQMLAGNEPGESVIERARTGAPDARAVIETFARWVAIGLSNITNITDPDVIVIGGGVSQGADLLIAPIRRWFAETLYAPRQRTHPELRMATLGERAGAVGAALLAEHAATV